MLRSRSTTYVEPEESVGMLAVAALLLVGAAVLAISGSSR
jgi:hypothetical protein